MEEQKPVEEMTPLEMAGELNERRQADQGVFVLMQQVTALKAILAQMGILVAFSPEEVTQHQAEMMERRKAQEEDFPNGGV